MSDAQSLPPASEPPSESKKPQFDFAKPFSYVFDDPDWVTKVLIGGLFYIAGFLIIGWFFILGYIARTVRNIIAGHERPLPEWENLGEFFNEGLRLIGVMLVIVLPLILLGIGIMIPASILGSVDNEGVAAFGSTMAGCIACLFFPLMLAVWFFMPAMLLFAVVEQRFGAAFEFRRIWPFIKQNIGNYVLAIVVAIIANFIANFGYMLLCIGVVFTGFWSFLITAHGFAQVYRLATQPKS